MNPTDVSHAATLALLHELDRAIAQHAQWLARFNRLLICGGATPSADLADDAHLRCAFGQWLHGRGRDALGTEPGFAAIEVAHRAMHDIAAHLLRAHAGGQTIAEADYDAFVAVAGRVRQLLRKLERDLMERLGAVDKLTGVWNRQAVHLRLAEEIERVQRTRLPCALCYADLDDFARVNERHGQRAGDAVLRAVAGLFSHRLRGYDTIYRLGGEEFLLCLPNTALDPAGALIERLRAELAATAIDVDGDDVHVTASFGVIALEPIFLVEETLERAERAQLIAKAEGGNRVCVWHDVWHAPPTAGEATPDGG